ncbi:hypothetical protein K1T71_010805 [Dendrolimus kikuchii]|uniref:Uncharacterized protein n=1 Tax=Dendrolimus kikuchii TaxID=765133 RepID=A0ACC1CPY7_9NEOP|nr:hypothetical protein K1T71_010805 [Dendrolimus kikuchii]
MKRKLIALSIFVLSLITWVYRSTNTEFNNTIRLIETNKKLLKDFLIAPSNKTCENKQTLVILITSYVGHVELRSAHRRAMPQDLLESMNVTRIFLLANIPEKEKYIKQEAINDESNVFGDILQGSFVEHYRNLTYKHLMGLRWASAACKKASFILKVDDDTVFNFQKTYKLLKSNINLDNSVLGYMLNDTRPRRNKENKWYVTWDEYPRSVYPSYVSGWYYIVTPKVASRIVDEAIYHPYFWIDDVLVTGILTEALSIKLIHVPNDFWLEYYELLECCIRDMIQKSIRCDHVVGPNGGRDNLIVEFNDAAKHCDSWGNCTVRSKDKPLKNVCVVSHDRSIFSEGKAEFNMLKL